jgi:hypothetical protein
VIDPGRRLYEKRMNRRWLLGVAVALGLVVLIGYRVSVAAAFIAFGVEWVFFIGMGVGAYITQQEHDMRKFRGWL